MKPEEVYHNAMALCELIRDLEEERKRDCRSLGHTDSIDRMRRGIGNENYKKIVFMARTVIEQDAELRVIQE